MYGGKRFSCCQNGARLAASARAKHGAVFHSEGRDGDSGSGQWGGGGVSPSLVRQWRVDNDLKSRSYDRRDSTRDESLFRRNESREIEDALEMRAAEPAFHIVHRFANATACSAL